MKRRLANLVHPCRPWRMALSRWRCYLEDELTYARIRWCEIRHGGHDMHETYDHINGSIWLCSRCPEVDS